MSKVKDLTVDELKELIEQTVERKLVELLGDPDKGLELREEVKARLKRSSARERRGVPGIPLEEVDKNLGLQQWLMWHFATALCKIYAR